MTSFAKNFICKKAKLFLFAVLVCSLSERVWGNTEAQRASCPECFKEDKAAADMKELNRLACDKMLKSPECEGVPRIFQTSCTASESGYLANIASCITSGAAGVGVVAVGGVFTMSALRLRVGAFRGNLLRSLLAFGVGGGIAALYGYYNYHREWKKSRSIAVEKGWTDDQHREYARGVTWARMSEKIYNTIYPNNLHCYNQLSKVARVCGTFMAVQAGAMGVGLWTGNPALFQVFTGLGLVLGPASVLRNASLSDYDKEFRKVQEEVKRKMREADPLLYNPDTL